MVQFWHREGTDDTRRQRAFSDETDRGEFGADYVLTPSAGHRYKWYSGPAMVAVSGRVDVCRETSSLTSRPHFCRASWLGSAHRIVAILCLLVFWFLISQSSRAAALQGAKPLTNADVIRMVAAGISSETIGTCDQGVADRLRSECGCVNRPKRSSRTD